MVLSKREISEILTQARRLEAVVRERLDAIHKGDANAPHEDEGADPK